MSALTLCQARTALTKGDLTALELTEQYLQAIQQREPKVKAYLRVEADSAREQAQRVDAKRRQGLPLGKLAGLPLAVKDVLCTKGVPTTAGSKMLRNYVPPYDAAVIAKLHEADAVLLGKTNLDEFAMGSSTENSAYQITCNPWDLTRTPGGSSGGSAAAVAAGEAAGAFGSDTGGSIRQPASFCGLVGLKPTYGRVSRFGLIAYGSSLDQIGPFGRCVHDVALLLEASAGHDARDATSLPDPVPTYTESLGKPVAPLTLGVPKEYFGAGLDPEVEQAVRAALKEYEKLGAKLVEVSLPTTPFGIAAYYLVATAEASSNLARYDGVHFGHRADKYAGLLDMVQKSRSEGFGTEVKRRILLGTYALSSGYIDAYYLKALQVRRLIKNDYDRAFAQCDVLVGPTAPTPAYMIGEKASDPLAMYLGDVYTIGCNLAGLPGVSIPCGQTRAGLPIGLQLQGPALSEEKLLRIAQMFERATDWHTRRPALVTG